MCLLQSLTDFEVSNSGTNVAVTCSPLCVSSVNSRSDPSSVCVYPQDNGLCGLIAATNIQSFASYTQWSCTTAGYTTTTPCLSPVWPGLFCNGINVVSIDIVDLSLTGTSSHFVYDSNSFEFI